MNTNNIKKRTNQLIGYENFRKEEEKRMKKMKNYMIVLGITTVFLGSAVTVNAMTDNGIVNKVKDALELKVKINGQDKNASCEKLGNGNIKCHMDKEVIGEDAEFDIEVDKEYQDKINMEMDVTEETVETNININE